MKKLQLWVLIFVFTFLMNSCVSNKSQEILKQVQAIPAKNMVNYSFNPDSSIESRISESPDFLLKYLMNMDKTENYSSYIATKNDIEMFIEYYNLLPSMNKQIMKNKLIAIYFVNNLYGSALADYVISEKLEMFNILIINPETMKHDMTEWLSYRENSCFIDSKDQIEVQCGDKYTGLMYTLIHESTHIVDYHLYITPYTEYSSFKVLNNHYDKHNIFLEEIWDNYNTPKEKITKDFMEEITFYNLSNGPKLSFSEAVSIYEELILTPFNSLYSCLSWAEDFAELTTWYHFTEILKQPYQIIIKENGKTLKQISPLENKMVQERLSLVQQLYN
jgi:hypothetical protein